MDALIETFHIDWKLIIAQAVNFGIVFVVLYVFALKPLQKLMTERKQRIDNGLVDASKNADMLAQTEQAYKQALAKARSEANDIIAHAKKEADTKRVEMIDAAGVEVDSIIIRGKQQLQSEKESLMQNIQNEIADLVVMATAKVIGASSDTVNTDMVNKAIKEIT